MKYDPCLSRRVLGYIGKFGLMAPEEIVLVGVSGGPDSVCLLHLLAGMRESLGIRLHVAHLNHGLRGAEAEADAAYVSRLARDMGLACTVERSDVLAHRTQHGESLEEAAREVRYGFFAQVAAVVGASRVAVGHTLDDQVESILLHILRGAGLRGLRGMQPLSRWGGNGGASLLVVRPLLEVSRQDTSRYCADHGLLPRVDVSNYSPAFLRNRLRQVMPKLETLNPSVDTALLRMGKAAAEVVEFFDQLVAQEWPQIVREERAEGLVMDRKRLECMAPPLQKHLLLKAWERVRGNPQDIESVHIEDMLSSLSRPVGSSLDLPGGLVFWTSYETVGLGQRGRDHVPCPYPAIPGEYPLMVPGETQLPGWTVLATVVDPSEAADRGAGMARCPSEALSACMDLEAAGRGLSVRSRRPGDRFYPLGLGGEKKLQDLMVDLKVPRGWRDRVPVVCSPLGVLWVVGYRLADIVKLTERTQHVLLLEFRPQKAPANG
ncbi:MAG: tRNA lysidine(34) synthetase TilS [Chloroflexi bacterium]|nr:tRNA lysidine(34) synthetase TilS [Chloroflexota bacterium]